MSRSRYAVPSRNRRKKVLKEAKGYRGARSKLYKSAADTVDRAQAFAYVGRKIKKRDFRKLWIQRINGAARAEGMSYSRFIEGLSKAKVGINRKMISEMAIHDPSGFSNLVKTAKVGLGIS